MLLDKYHNLAHPISESLETSGKQLVVVSSSPLAELMAATQDVNMIDISSSADVVGINRHDIVLDALVKRGVQTIRSTMHKARNVVRPIVKDIHEDIVKATDTAAITHMEYTITPTGLPAVYSVPALSEVVRGFDAQLPLTESVPEDMVPSFSAEELDKHAKLNISSIDAAMDELYEANPDLRSAVLATLFTKWATKELITDEETIAAFVIARGLFSSIPNWDETGSIGIKSHLAGVGAIMGTRIKAIIRKREAAVRRKALVVGVSGKEISVDQNIYTDYLKNGGEADVVIGSVIAGEVTGTVAALNAKADEYKEAYRRYVNVSLGNVANVKRKTMQRIINEEMRNLILTDEVFKKDSAHYMARLQAAQDSSVLNSTDPYPYVLNLVCNTLYEGSSALQILSGIDALTEEKSITPREAATIVMHDMVNEWLLSMLRVEPAKKR